MVHRGEVYISIAEAAHWYGLERAEVEGWVVARLLQVEAIEGVAALRAAELDRLAGLVRCTRLLGLDAAAFGLLDPADPGAMS
jgi:hypothetical protein